MWNGWEIFRFGIAGVALLMLGSVFGASQRAAADSIGPLQWTGHPDGTVHYYELISSPDRIYTWDDAKQLAESRAHAGLLGHLATITTSEEDAFLRNMSGFFSPPFSIGNNRVWIAAFQPLPELVATGWEWTTGEPWAFTNWGPGEPNDGLPSFHEDAVFIDILPPRRHWVDGARSSLQGGFIVEYDAFGATAPEPSTLFLAATMALILILRRHLAWSSLKESGS